MKHYLASLVMLVVMFLSACGPNPRADVATAFPSPRAALATIIAPGKSTPEAAIATIIKTLEPMATASASTICVMDVGGCNNGGCFSYYEIIEGTQMTDAACDALIQRIQAGLDAIPDPETGNTATAIRVYSYPTSPIICSKAYTGHSTLTIVDTGKSVVSQKLCESLP